MSHEVVGVKKFHAVFKWTLADPEQNKILYFCSRNVSLINIHHTKL